MSRSLITEGKRRTAEMLIYFFFFCHQYFRSMATNGKKKNTLPHLGHSQTAFEVSRILLFSGHWVLARRIVKPGKRLPEAVVQSPPLTMFKAQLDKAWPTLFDVEIFSRRVEWVTSKGPFQSRFFCYSNNIHSK